ncbi:MAG: PatB family C-S lyase [Caldilineaceae bacterium]
MNYDFDRQIDRRASDSGKWNVYGEDILPMWVADMDFESPEPIVRSLHERADVKVFGYGRPPQRLGEVLAERMLTSHNWQVSPEQFKYIPGLVSGLNVVTRAVGELGDGVLVNTPVYMPFLAAPANQGRVLNVGEMARTLVNDNGHQRIRYEIDFDALEAAITPRTRLFILCNPHNPVGRAYTREELQQIGELCIKHDLILCSDEIHCDLLMGNTRHISVASLSPEIAERTITLIAPSKTFNVPGLGCSAMIIQNKELRARVDQAAIGIVPHVTVMGYVSALAAYADPECEEWRQQLLAYLTANRDFLTDYVDTHLPQVRTTAPEATYLAWLDLREAGVEGNPQTFCLEQAKVAFNNGAAFGQGGEGFVRLNYGCTRATLQEGLERLRHALG